MNSHLATGLRTEVADLELGGEPQSLADLIAMSYWQGRPAGRVLHFPDSRALFTQLESGVVEAALIDECEFDAWRLCDGVDLRARRPHARTLKRPAFAEVAKTHRFVVNGPIRVDAKPNFCGLFHPSS